MTGIFCAFLNSDLSQFALFWLVTIRTFLKIKFLSKNSILTIFTFRQIWIFCAKIGKYFWIFYPKKSIKWFNFRAQKSRFWWFWPKIELTKNRKKSKNSKFWIVFCLKSSVKVDSKLTQFVKLQYTPKIPWVEKQIIHLSKRKWSSDHFDKIFCSIEFLGT